MVRRGGRHRRRRLGLSADRRGGHGARWSATTQGVAHEYFLPGGPFAILPLTDQRASLVWTETPARAAALKTARPEVVPRPPAPPVRRLPGRGRGRGPALHLSAVPAAGRAADRAPRGPAGRRRPRHPPDRRPGPEPGPEGRRGPGRGAGRGRAPGRGHRLGRGAGALRRAGGGSTTSPWPLATDAFIRLFSNDNPLLRAGARRRHGGGQPHRPGPALLHAAKPAARWATCRGCCGARRCEPARFRTPQGWRRSIEDASARLPLPCPADRRTPPAPQWEIASLRPPPLSSARCRRLVQARGPLPAA